MSSISPGGAKLAAVGLADSIRCPTSQLQGTTPALDEMGGCVGAVGAEGEDEEPDDAVAIEGKL